MRGGQGLEAHLHQSQLPGLCGPLSAGETYIVSINIVQFSRFRKGKNESRIVFVNYYENLCKLYYVNFYNRGDLGLSKVWNSGTFCG